MYNNYNNYNKQVLRFLKKNEYEVNKMSMSFTNRENSVIDEPRKTKQRNVQTIKSTRTTYKPE